jgi:phage antirepressor YoqD-like protein
MSRTRSASTITILKPKWSMLERMFGKVVPTAGTIPLTEIALMLGTTSIKSLELTALLRKTSINGSTLKLVTDGFNQ